MMIVTLKLFIHLTTCIRGEVKTALLQPKLFFAIIVDTV